MYCKNCGAQIDNEEFTVCPVCGKPLRENGLVELKKADLPSNKKKSSEKILLIILAVLLVGAVTAGGILFYKEKSDRGSNNKIEVIETKDKDVNEYKQLIDTLKKELEESQKAQADASIKQAESLLAEQKYKQAYKVYEKALEDLKEQQKEIKSTPTPDIKQKQEEKTEEQRRKEQQELEKSHVKMGIHGYLFYESDERFIEASELKGYTAAELKLMRNEIYARRGRLFDAKEVQEYFDQCPWYCGYIKPNDFDESCFNKYEKANIDTIVEMEKRFK